MLSQRSLPSLNDVLIAIANSDDDDRLCSREGGSVNVYALHPKDVRGYVNLCVMPCGDEGHLVQVVVREDGDERILWVH